ncbi:MAG: hypothetical protein KC547_07500 [Anaerolineae bacterium]|nr:hypothetical protein [Anaerolineae bacterium]
MESAARVLIIAGLLNIAYGLLTGLPASMIRRKNPTYSKYLRFVHVGALMWGPILISLALAIGLSALDVNTAMIAAWLMVIASVLLDAKDTINWLRGTQDEFAENARLPLLLGGLSSLASLVGIAIILVGVVQAVGKVDVLLSAQ